MLEELDLIWGSHEPACKSEVVGSGFMVEKSHSCCWWGFLFFFISGMNCENT